PPPARSSATSTWCRLPTARPGSRPTLRTSAATATTTTRWTCPGRRAGRPASTAPSWRPGRRPASTATRASPTACRTWPAFPRACRPRPRRRRRARRPGSRRPGRRRPGAGATRPPGRDQRRRPRPDGAPGVRPCDHSAMEQQRIIGAAATREDEAIEASIRPRRLDEYLGQEPVREQMGLYIEAARHRGEALDHVLIFGPPGLGKTTLSHVIANELGVSLRITSGPVIEKAGDLAALLTNLQPNDVLFIDEIHRLSPVVEEVLYPAMEDFQLDIMIGEGPAARSIK